MPFIEAPTTFYLGREFDPKTDQLEEDVVYYDSRDLTTHAVVVGMTGSGKTGLCITMLEEAILDNIPAIIIDPKGDITNLLLTFPELRPEDFLPWVNTDDALRARMEPPQYAADVARRWREGLQNWGIVPDRLRWLQRAAKYSIFTPGSDAGLPVSILASLRAPREGWMGGGGEETHRERINGTVTALLALIGKNVVPVQDKEHVLIANIFEYAWKQGKDLTLEDIILQVQRPPFEKLGVFSVDDYMPEKKRYQLAMELNNIVAAPSFSTWIQGQPMDIHSLLYQPNGRPRVSIFYVAHLSDAERMFIVTLLLENMLGYMRTLSGTTSLRALLYMDEIYGYFPPYPKNPPTKEPLLRLLKQARAFGVGLILATQNPGDLDYKGLSNAGTWFIGRLQSENDKARVMSGLESMATADNNLNLKEVERLISDISPRVFLMHNVHSDAPRLVHTRWAMNYLRGPLTRQQISLLMASQKQELMQQISSQYYAQQHPGMGASGAYTQFQHQAAPQVAMPATAPRPFAPPETGAYVRTGATPPPMPPETGSFGVGGGVTPPPAPPETGIYNPQAVPQYAPPIAPPPINYGWTNQATVPQSQVNFPPPQSAQPTTIFDPQSAIPPRANVPQGFTLSQPAVPSTTKQYFLPTTLTAQQAVTQWQQQMSIAVPPSDAVLAYKPVLLAQAAVRYQDKKTNLYTSRTYAFHIPNLDRVGLIHWEEYQAPTVDARSVSSVPLMADAIYGELPSGLTDAKRLSTLQSELVDMLYTTARLTIPFNPVLKIYGNPDQDFAAYQAQVQQTARELRDQEIDKVAQKYQALVDKAEDRRTRKERELRAEQKELKDRKREELFTTGEAALSLFRGRTTYTMSRVSRASRMRRQTDEDLKESREVLREIDEEIDQLEARFEEELRAVNEKWAQVAANSQEYLITPYKKDIYVELFGIGWIPHYYAVAGGQPLLLNAFV